MRTIYFTLLAGIILIILSCNKEEHDFAPIDIPVSFKTTNYIPFYQLGDTVHSGPIDYNRDTATIVIDSSSNHSFNIIAWGQPDYVAYGVFIELVINVEDSIQLLKGATPVNSPIVSTFQFGDHVSANMQNWWYPTTSNNTTWLKYETYLSGQVHIVDHLAPGENYLAFKYGSPGNERHGWMNFVYQDTICYLKEGYFLEDPNTGIVVGDK